MHNPIGRLAFCLVGLLLSASLSAQGNDTLTILFAGDAIMHQTQIDNTRRGDTFDLSGYFPLLEREIKAADISVVNMEVPLGGKPYSGYPVFSAPTDFAVALQRAGFNFFLLANNHCLDKRTNGLVRTIQILDSLGIRHTGTYLDQAHRAHTYPMLLRKNGFRIIMLNYTYSTNGFQVEAPRIVNYIDKKQMEIDIAEAKLFNPDFIIANMHWGVEYNQLPSAEQRDLADWLIEQGVDLVMGGHPHVIQPMEIRKDKDGTPTHLVVYSLGNLVSNMSLINTDGGALLKVTLARKGLKRYIVSAEYALVFNERYQNDRGKKDMHILPAPRPVDGTGNILPVHNPVWERFLKSSRSLLQKHNIGVEEYFIE
ncbi:CapA family protein [Parabacteroides sp. AM08-6]|nr:CapA family protein [Parabacteroides sp. AM08-6]